MIKSTTLLTIGSWLTFLGVIIIALIMWLNTNPSGITATDPELIPLAVESINEESVIELNSLSKNGNLPVVTTPSDLGRDNPFATY